MQLFCCYEEVSRLVPCLELPEKRHEYNKWVACSNVAVSATVEQVECNLIALSSTQPPSLDLDLVCLDSVSTE